MKSKIIFPVFVLLFALSACSSNEVYVDNSFFDKEILSREKIEDLPEAPGISLVYKKEHGGSTNAIVYIDASAASSDYALFYASAVYDYLIEKSFKHIYTVDGPSQYSSPAFRAFACKLKEARKLDDFYSDGYYRSQTKDLLKTWTFVFSNDDFKENTDGDKYMKSPHCIVISAESVYRLTYNKKTITYSYSVEIDSHSSFWLV